MASEPDFSPPTIALFPWGDVIEDFLDTINLSLEAFCQDMTGGWLFGYIEALKLEGIQTVIYCISARVVETTRYTHQPTGATICAVPAPRIYQWVRRSQLQLHQANGQGTTRLPAFIQRPLLTLLNDIAPYVANPSQQLAQEVRRDGCSAILCQEYEYARFDICILLGKLLRLPVFATFQGGNFQTSRLERFIRPHTLQASAGLIVPSQVEIQRLQSHYPLAPKKITQIFNPLDLSLWQGEQGDDRSASRTQTRETLQLPVDAKVVVYHGRIEMHRKGLDVLMDAWTWLCREHPQQNWWLLLVGTGSDAEILGDRITSLPKSNVCWINEYVLDRSLMRRYLEAADLYTLPSRHEGFPVAPLEAMACGLPVVATNAPGVQDILEGNEQSGGVVVPCEQPEALAEAIARLLTNDPLRQHLAQQALYRIASCFSLQTVGAQLRTLLTDPVMGSAHNFPCQVEGTMGLFRQDECGGGT